MQHLIGKGQNDSNCQKATNAHTTNMNRDSQNMKQALATSGEDASACNVRERPWWTSKSHATSRRPVRRRPQSAQISDSLRSSSSLVTLSGKKNQVRRYERDGTRPRSLLGSSPIGSPRPSQSIRRVGCVRVCVCGMATARDRGAGGGSASRVGDGDVDLGEGWDWGAIPRLLSSACLFLCSGWVRFAHAPLSPLPRSP